MKTLIIIDVQNDFCPDGALAVENGDAIIDIINALQHQFDIVIATQDWHPANHQSFAANHDDKNVGDVIEIAGLPQVLWPTHCVQNTRGAEFYSQLNMQNIAKIFRKGEAEFYSQLNMQNIAKIFRKGEDETIDSYSGFFDNGHQRATGLGDYLKAQNVDEVFICGLATDYCVKFSALDARQLGFEVTLIEDACRGVELHEGDIARSIDAMREAGVKIVQSATLLG